jgi:hypothetical protein
MEGKQPATIISDQDVEMKETIPAVFTSLFIGSASSISRKSLRKNMEGVLEEFLTCMRISLISSKTR